VALHIFASLSPTGESLLFSKLTPWRHSAHLSGKSTSRRDIINYFRQYAAVPPVPEMSNLAIIPSVLVPSKGQNGGKVHGSGNAKTSITNPMQINQAGEGIFNLIKTVCCTDYYDLCSENPNKQAFLWSRASVPFFPGLLFPFNFHMNRITCRRAAWPNILNQNEMWLLKLN